MAKKPNKKPNKKSKKRCRHTWGPWRYEDSDVYQVCRNCGAGRFRGDRYAYTSRWRKP